MKSRLLLILGGVIVLVVILGAVGAAGWYLASPLFVDNVVEEAFPFDTVPAQEQIELTQEQHIEEVVAVEAVDPEPAVQAAAAAETMAEVLAEEPASTPELVLASEEAMAQDNIEPAIDATPVVDEVMEPTPEAQPVAVLQGQFQDADSFHRGAGQATVYRLPDGSHVLRFEEFEVTNGPDLHVLLSTHPAPTNRAEVMEGYLDLGQLKGNVGSQNYEIPPETDLSQYKSIVIYCEPFHVVFSTATLGG
jgi:hypothetical protein